MADISKLSRLLNGIQRQVDLASNTLVVSEVKVGGASGTVLTKTDLDTLLGAGGVVDASSLHHHDGRYFTQSQLGSTASGSAGASLIGADSVHSYVNIATPSDMQDAIEKLDAALSSAGATEFADDVFRINDDGDATKQIAFQAAGITTATTRTLTIQDKDIIVAGTADETFSGTTTVDKLQVDGQAYSPINDNGTSGAAKTIDWDTSNVQLLELTDNVTLTFSNGTDGGQYLLILDQDGTGGHSVTFPADVEFIGPAADIQQGAGERTVVSFFYDSSKTSNEYQGLSSNDIVSMANGGTGANLSPIDGAIVYTDSDSMELLAPGTAGQILQTNGAAAPSWLTLAGGDGVAYSSGTFSVDLATDPGLEFNSGQLRVLVDPAGAINRAAAGISVNVDDSTIEKNSNAIRVKADGINETHIQLSNNTFLQALNSGAFSTDIIGLNASDKIVFGSLPQDSTVPTNDADLVNKLYVDNAVAAAAAGLDPKESVRFATLDAITGTYNASGGTGGSGEFTNVDLTDTGDFDLDGNTVAIGDRILLKNQANAQQNGIYVVTTAGATGVIERATDQDGTPANEVSGGNHTFVELGATYANSGWVVVGDGNLTLNTDDIVWTQFSAAGAFTGGDGIDITSGVISIDLATNSGLEFSAGELQVDLLASGGLKLVGNELTVEPADFAGNGLEDDGSDNMKLAFDALTAASMAAGDFLAFHDADEATAETDHKKIAFSDFLDGVAGAGLARNGVALDVQAGDGIEVVGDAVALDIDGISGTATDLEAADLFAIHDDSAGTNAKITVANALGQGLGLSSGKIAAQLGNGIEFDTSDNMKLAFDALVAETAVEAGDVLAFHDLSAAGDADHKKITVANLLTQLAGDGLTVSGAGLAVSAGEGIQITGDAVALDINSLSSETAADDADELVFYDTSAGSHKKITRANLIGDLSVLAETMVAGETMEANTVHAIRMAVDTETAGRVYKADIDASSADNFYVVGLAINDTASAISAGSDIRVVKVGGVDLEASDLSFVAADAGKPVYLSSTGNLTLTAPAAANEAVVKVGVLRDVASNGKVEVQVQIMGIN